MNDVKNVETNNKKNERTQEEITAIKKQIVVFVKQGKALQAKIRNGRIGLLQIFYDAKFVHNFIDRDVVKLSDKLGYTKSTRSKINTIVKNEVLMSNLDSLPSSWGTLYLLKNVSEDVLKRLINQDKINVDMTFFELRDLLVEEQLLESKGNVVELVTDGVFKFNYDDTYMTSVQLEKVKSFVDTVQTLAKGLTSSGIQIECSTINLELLLDADLEAAA